MRVLIQGGRGASFQSSFRSRNTSGKLSLLLSVKPGGGDALSLARPVEEDHFLRPSVRELVSILPYKEVTNPLGGLVQDVYGECYTASILVPPGLHPRLQRKVATNVGSNI